MDYFLCVIGMVMIIEGLPYFTVPHKMREWLYKVFELPDSSLRGAGFFLMATGLFLVWLGRR